MPVVDHNPDLEIVRRLTEEFNGRMLAGGPPAGSRERDQRCFDYFLGAQRLAYLDHGDGRAIFLYMVLHSVIAIRGWHGLQDYCWPPEPGRRPESVVIRWEYLPYKGAGEFADVDGGRLLVQRVKPSAQHFTGLWNGTPMGTWRGKVAAKRFMEAAYRQGRLHPPQLRSESPCP